MVKQVQAYQASDGQIFGTEWEAARHDATILLRATGFFNEASILKLVTEPTAVVTALAPLAKYAKKESSDAQS